MVCILWEEPRVRSLLPVLETRQQKWIRRSWLVPCWWDIASAINGTFYSAVDSYTAGHDACSWTCEPAPTMLAAACHDTVKSSSRTGIVAPPRGNRCIARAMRFRPDVLHNCPQAKRTVTNS